jgi:hypothetical protein
LLDQNNKYPQGYFVRLEELRTGRIHFTDLMQQKDYLLTNLRLGYEQKNYSVYLFTKNLTDCYYYSFKIDNVRGVPSDS